MSDQAFSPPLSILDLAHVGRGQTPADSFATSVALAQRAEALGYTRVWYAEHHNIAGIASSATSVLIAHIGAHTESIRLGSGGIMLPNHAPLQIAEQFGTLEAMYPGRIDLGLGRAPGSDQATMRALRRDPTAADTFPQDIRELQGYLAGESLIDGVQAIPGAGSDVPLYILGSSLFGARLAAAYGLPYAFASHFAPAALEAALAAYRENFTPSAQLETPYAMAAMNILAADTTEEARAQLQAIRRTRAVSLFGRQLGLGGRDASEVSDAQADELLAAGAGPHVDQMLTHTATGTGDQVRRHVERFLEQTGVDELITAHPASNPADRIHSVQLLAEAMRPVAASA
jgi:luciferase family oxidoreductase group 1